MSLKGKSSILIVDDHPIFRHGLTQLINQEEDLVVCGEAEDYHSGWKAVKELNPDMLIVDITLKNMSGIDLIREINKSCKGLPMLVLSMHEESLYAERSLRAGARGYIMKQEASESIVYAIREVLNGRIYASRNITDALLARFIDGSQGSLDSPVQSLTNRELEVFQMIGDGMSIRDIGARLNLSVKTIGTYRERIKEKLQLKNATELLRYAMNWVEDERRRKE